LSPIVTCTELDDRQQIDPVMFRSHGARPLESRGRAAKVYSLVAETAKASAGVDQGFTITLIDSRSFIAR
jgi:hypothetical protein